MGIKSKNDLNTPVEHLRQQGSYFQVVDSFSSESEWKTRSIQYVSTSSLMYCASAICCNPSLALHVHTKCIILCYTIYMYNKT